MSYLILAFFCLLPFGSFFFRQVDIWHGQGQYVQIGILILFCYSFFEKGKVVQILNKPLGAFILWCGLVTSANWIIVFSLTKHYPIKIFLPFFNLLCLVWLYKIIVEYCTRNYIEKIFKWLKYSILIVLVYCVLQWFQLDQFFKSLETSVDMDCLVGTIGNQSHLAAFLAVVQPLFFNKNRQDILCLILLWIILILTGSVSGLVCGTIVLLFWLFFNNKKLALFSSILALLIFSYIFITHSSFFTNSGRFDIWLKVFEIFKSKPITGMGLGSLSSNAHWQHLHNEYYQIALETGVIGLGLVLWCIWDYFKIFLTIKSDVAIKLVSMFLGFCLLGLFTFNAHLWLISVFGMMAYAGIYCIKNEVIN